MTPLANVIMSGSMPQRSGLNHSPRRPKPAITASTTCSTPVRLQSASTPSMCRPRGWCTPPAPITGSTTGRDALGAHALDLGLERLERVVRHLRGVGVERADVDAVGGDAAEARAEPVRAVVALRARDQVHALGLADGGE